MLSSKLVFVINLLAFLVFGAVVALEILESQEYGMSIMDLVMMGDK